MRLAMDNCSSSNQSSQSHRNSWCRRPLIAGMGRGLMSMRLEFWGAWGLEFRPDFDAHESAWISSSIGVRILSVKSASLAAKNTPPKQKLVTMLIDVDGIYVCND